MNVEPPNTRRLQLDITYRCGMGCHNCNRFTQLVPGTTADDMTVAQVEKMLADSVELHYPWNELDLLGGEPTIHPDMGTIAGLLDGYRAKHNPKCVLRLYSHGRGKAGEVAENIKTRYPAYEIVVNQNTSVPPYAIKTGVSKDQFYAASLAPVDLHPEWDDGRYYEGCPVSWHCGMGMNFSGYYCCAIAAAIDRVFQLDCAIRQLADVNPTALETQYQLCCRYCGHYREVACGNEQTWLSPAWVRALERRK